MRAMEKAGDKAAAPVAGRPLRILTFTTLYPNAAQPAHGVFVENRLRHLVDGGGIEARVLAPVPWFPFAGAAFGAYGRFARVPRVERRHGLDVHHPRYPVVPKIGMSVTPATLYLTARRAAARLMADGFDVDLIDAHYVYPDGVAAVLLGRHLGRPVTVTARGTDINLIPRYALPRRMIRWAAGHADGLITVCQALKDELVALGVAADRVRVLRNGVDLDRFRPEDPARCRTELGLAAPVLLSVGGLIPRKGHDLVIRALAQVPAATLVIAGEGPERTALAGLAADLGLASRVRFVGRIDHDGLRRHYSAADALILASSREGWANVLLEAMACGTPVVASNVWGTPEVVAAPEAGVLVGERSADAIAAAVLALLAAPPGRARTRAYAERFSWDDTSRGQRQLFTEILARRRSD
jgi:glycosyltransferase involved in cell wall biosynthesis